MLTIQCKFCRKKWVYNPLTEHFLRYIILENKLMQFFKKRWNLIRVDLKHLKWKSFHLCCSNFSIRSIHTIAVFVVQFDSLILPTHRDWFVKPQNHEVVVWKKSHDSVAIACAKLSLYGLMVTIGCVQLLLLSAANKVFTKLLITISKIKDANGSFYFKQDLSSWTTYWLFESQKTKSSVRDIWWLP